MASSCAFMLQLHAQGMLYGHWNNENCIPLVIANMPTVIYTGSFVLKVIVRFIITIMKKRLKGKSIPHQARLPCH